MPWGDITKQSLKMVTQRLSLRPPQARSLEILAEVLERVELGKGADPAAALAAIREAWPQVEDFEREFPSLCFALATGVGKTRLMGAFISYLYLTGRSRHFFVLAPNRTIYEKLIADFSPESPKYVFRGIAEFAQLPPLVITGDNYETGRGVRLEGGRSADLFGSDVHINIFNIDKINKEESPRGQPKMKRLQETIGESYYAYLSKLDDLVLLMDEAHRYRASAGARAIDGLKPILGLELTATPKTVGSNSVPFRNVIYSYGLGEAMADGFVKEPAVATRKDFDPRSVPPERLETIKLEDAVHYHDHVAVELDRFHRVDRPAAGSPVHPRRGAGYRRTRGGFAPSSSPRSSSRAASRARSPRFTPPCAARRREEATQRLVALEQDSRTDIVIHVNKLKEGWDVTNLYTIVPLRASASEILTEQTLGRGLRLPFGSRVSKGDDDEFAAIDRLTVIAHDRFDEIIQKAREPGSIVMKAIEIGEGADVSTAGAVLIESPSIVQVMVTGAQAAIPGISDTPQAAYIFDTPEEGKAAEVTLDVIARYERRLGSVEALRDADVQRKIADEVRELIRPVQGTLEGVITAPRIEKIVEAVATTVADRTISIPQIVVLPKRQVTFTFADFDLKNLETINVQPIDDGLVIQNLRTEARLYLAKADRRSARGAAGGLPRPPPDRAQRDRLRRPRRLALHARRPAGGAGAVLSRHRRRCRERAAPPRPPARRVHLRADDAALQRDAARRRRLRGADHAWLHAAQGAAAASDAGAAGAKLPPGGFASFRHQAPGVRRLHEVLLSRPEVPLRSGAALRRPHRRRGERREMAQARSRPVQDRAQIR